MSRVNPTHECAVCRYWFVTSPDARGDVRGECRRGRPSVWFAGDKVCSGWPVTRPNAWCGEFKLTPAQRD